MAQVVNAWQKDGKGFFFEMDKDEKKDYSLDYTDWLALISDTIATVVWTIPAGITKISEQVTGAVAKVVLRADTLGTYSCSMKLTTTGTLIEILNFRVIVE